MNGWNNSSEINGDKTLAFGLTWKPTDKLTWIANDMFGKETAGSERHSQPLRHHPHLGAARKLSLMGNYDYGREGDTKWWGIAAYAKLQATPELGPGRPLRVPGRHGRRLHDLRHQGRRRFTLTSDHLIAGSLKARLEYRTDFADEAIFPKDDGLDKKSQTTLTVGLVYGFGGKI